MYVAVIPNRGSPPAILLRESYRAAGKTKNRTLANLSRWPAERIEQLRAVLRGDKLLPRRRGGGNRPRAAAWPRARRARHRAPHRARRAAAAPGAATPARSGAGPDRRAAARAGGQAGDGADAGSGHRQPFAPRHAGAPPSPRPGGLWRARLAGARAAAHRSHACPPPPAGWRAAALTR